MTKIAIVSDSHGRIDRLETLLSNLQKSGIKTVIHAGDFLVEGVIEILKKFSTLQIHIARGNCDVNEVSWEEVVNLPHVKAQEVLKIQIEDTLIAVSHIQGWAQNAYQTKDIDIFIHGHTHRRKIETKSHPIILNPGALTDDGAYLILSLPDKKVEVKWFSDMVEL